MRLLRKILDTMVSGNELITSLSRDLVQCAKIDLELFKKYNVKRGLRNEDGTGVLVGLTKVGNVVGYDQTPEGIVPAEGRLFFREYDVRDIIHSAVEEGRFGYEEVCFLLLSGRLPSRHDLESFRRMLMDNMFLEQRTILHIIEMGGNDIMNILARSVLEMYTFDDNPDDLSPENLMRQSIELISKFPTIIAYAYNMLRHQDLGRTFHLRNPQDNYSLAENFLYMLKGPGFSKLEAQTLDVMMILHAEHGGGNNSTFTVRVTSSTGTDTYSSIAAGIGSLKGPKHGGANIQVSDMVSHIRDNVKNWEDEQEIMEYLRKILRKEAYDRTGLIYGIGHAVYTLSDPRAVLLKEMAYKLALEKDRLREFEFMTRLERLAIEAVYEAKGRGKILCANVDFYSGFVYQMLGLPKEIYTPLFAMARIVGWCAHRNEELNFDGKRIIRPAYRVVSDRNVYIPIDKR